LQSEEGFWRFMSNNITDKQYIPFRLRLEKKGE